MNVSSLPPSLSDFDSNPSNGRGFKGLLFRAFTVCFFFSLIFSIFDMLATWKNAVIIFRFIHIVQDDSFPSIEGTMGCVCIF